MMHRHAIVFAALAAAALTAAGCAASTSGTGHGSAAPTAKPVVSATPLAPTTTSTPTPVVPTTSAAPSTATTNSTGGCPRKAKYCDQFSDTSSGWPVTNDAHYFAQYDPYEGGTYRLGERRAATITEQAPTDISRVASDYSVQIDVDASPYRTMPLSTSAGIDCWEHQSNGHTSAFLFFVNPSTVEVGLWDESTGAYHKIASKSDAGLVRTDGSPNHLTAACVQASKSGGVTAELGMEINGKVAIVAQYAKSTKNYSWDVAPDVGVLASGKGADVFYDNFAITSLCSGDYC